MKQQNWFLQHIKLLIGTWFITFQNLNVINDVLNLETLPKLLMKINKLLNISKFLISIKVK